MFRDIMFVLWHMVQEQVMLLSVCVSNLLRKKSKGKEILNVHVIKHDP